MSNLKEVDKRIKTCYVLFSFNNVQTGEDMGVVYKIKTQIRDFILEQKKICPELSCRNLTALIEDKLQIKVSKSSINSIFKESGLSMPVGRRLRKKRHKLETPIQIEAKSTTLLLEQKIEEPIELVKQVPPPIKAPEVKEEIETFAETPSEMQCTGAILLKAADSLIGGSYYISEAVRNRLNKQNGHLLAQTEGLLFLPLWGEPEGAQNKDLCELWAIIGEKIPLKSILSYHNELQSVSTISLDILRIISNILQEVRCIKVNLPDGNVLYLDGQLRTVWSTLHIPYSFSSTIYDTKSYINKYFYQNFPLVLFMAPGYDSTTKEFFNFISGLNSKEKNITRLTLCGNKFEDLEAISLEQGKRRFFVFGLWPWQFVENRKIRKIGEFKPFYSDTLKKDFYIAEIELELTQPNTGQSVTLKGYALKTNTTEKARLVILSNLPTEEIKPERLVNSYLGHWPNLEESFQDYSRKIELYTYTASSQRFSSTESMNLYKDASREIKALFANYLKSLDLYVKWHFLPSGYENKDFSTVKEQFYDLKAVLKKENSLVLVKFLPPQGFRFQKELEYLLRRLNEKEIPFGKDKRLWFSV